MSMNLRNRLRCLLGALLTGAIGLVPCPVLGQTQAEHPLPPIPPAPPRDLLTIKAPPPPTRAELQKLEPGEREARMKAIRDRKVLSLKEALTPAEKEKRRQEIRQRLEKRLEALQKKKKERPLTTDEEKQLRRLEEVQKRFQSPKKGKTDSTSPPATDKK